eukprot:108566-Pyramimonas_sp.AAC.1
MRRGGSTTRRLKISSCASPTRATARRRRAALDVRRVLDEKGRAIARAKWPTGERKEDRDDAMDAREGHNYNGR